MVIFKLYVVDTPPTRELIVGVPVMDNVNVPFSRTGSLNVNCAGGTDPSDDLTLKGTPGFIAVNIKFPPTPDAPTIVDCKLIKFLSLVVIATGPSPAVEVTV